MISASLFDALSTHGRLILVGGLLILVGLALFAAMFYVVVRRLRIAYVEQARKFSRCRLSGREVVGRLLEHVGLSSVGIDDGAKIDHYDQLRRRVKLRTESSVASSVAALAIAAHEVGHAEQFAKGYWAARAAVCLLVLLVIGAAVVFVYPFATTIAAAGTVNLTGLVALGLLLAVLRLPVTIALERDATQRGLRLLNETKLAHETELPGITHFLRAGFRTHIVFGLGLILVVGAGIPTMWLVESGLSAPALTSVQVAPVGELERGELEPGELERGELERGEPLPPMQVIGLSDFSYPIAVLMVAIAALWWAFSGGAKKAPVRNALDVSNEGMARFQAGDLAGAIALFDEALRLEPALASAHYNRAVVLTSQGRSPEALASIEALFL
jgi:Zn-dependent membrane protease YugP